MAYVDPNTVLSPKNVWDLGKVVLNTGEGGWSAAEGKWDSRPVMALRWNGSANDTGVGSPQSRGYPTWFIIPDELESGFRKMLDEFDSSLSVDLKIYKPADYEHGAWRMEAKIVGTDDELLNSVAFAIPNLPSRICHSEKGFLKAVGAELRGCFQGGVWYGDLYTNGVPEDENPTSIAMVEEAFRQSMQKALQFAI
jgi:hypothetical protein